MEAGERVGFPDGCLPACLSLLRVHPARGTSHMAEVLGPLCAQGPASLIACVQTDTGREDFPAQPHPGHLPGAEGRGDTGPR